MHKRNMKGSAALVYLNDLAYHDLELVLRMEE